MSYSIRNILTLLLVSFSLSLAMASEDHYDDLFGEANAAYKNGAYDSAKTIYTEIAQNGMVSKELFYNLGNSHFKLGNVAASILYYERALRLDPTDEDIRYNLKIANGMITDKIEPLNTFFLTQWWRDIASSFSGSFWAWAFIVVLLFMSTLLTFFFASRNPKMRQLGLLGGLGVGVAAIVLFLLGQTQDQIQDRTEAIVFASSVHVLSEPSVNGTEQFVLHSGIKVEVLDEDGDWSRIRLADGNSGWLPIQSIEEI